MTLRPYIATHPWLRFSVDLRLVTWDMWVRLGEARSKIDHLSRIPLKPATAAELHRVYLAKGALATTAIEGNTLSEEEARAIVDGRSSMPPSKEYLQREIENIIVTCNWVMGRLDNLDQRITPEVICEFNERVLAGLEVEPGVVPGQYRVHGVAVGDVYRGAPADDVPHLVGEMCEWLNRPDFLSDDPERRIIFAIVRAVLAHLYIAWIHPFGDGNGRTARLVEFLSLVVAGAPSAAAHLLSNHYNETRSEYYRQLAAASRNGGDVTPFLAYAIQGLVDQLRTQIERVYLQILNDAWQNHVHESVPGTSEVAQRQRNLVLDLTAVGQPLSIDDLAGVSPRVASAYGRRSPKTLVRDVNTLVAKGLLLKDAAGVAANTSVVLGLLPPRVVQP